MRRWRTARIDTLYSHRLFRLERHELEEDAEARRESMVLAAPDWVNVIPLLPDDRVLLVR
jgi:hypothetical protein